VKRLRAVLAALATASVPSDMALPGLRLHPWRADRAGQWSMSISRNWRVIFRPG
jgi:toxin HigB-1